MDRADPRVLVDIPRCDVRIIADEQQIVASYNPIKRQETFDQNRESDLADDVICNIEDAAKIIAANPGFLLFGFETDAPSPDVHRVTGPSNTLLNERRAELAATTGIHTGIFIDSTETFVDFPKFLQLLSQRNILFSISPNSMYVAHDNIFHRLGYTKMCSAIFDRFSEMAGVAIERGDSALIEELAIVFDQIGGMLGHDKGDNPDKVRNNLVLQYKKFLHPLAAGIFAAVDAQAQADTDRKLHRLVRMRKQFASKLDSCDDLDTRIDAVIDLKDMVADALIEQNIPPERILLHRGKFNDQVDTKYAVRGWILYEDIEVEETSYNLEGKTVVVEKRTARGCILDEFGGILKHSGQFISPNYPGLQKFDGTESTPEGLLMLSRDPKFERHAIASDYAQKRFPRHLADLVVRTGLQLPIKQAA